MRQCIFCGGDLDSTAGCWCPRPVMTSTVPVPICVPQAYPAPVEPSNPFLYTDPVDWRTRALAAEARATKAERERDALQRDMTFAADVYRNTLATMVQRESYQMREQERDRAREALRLTVKALQGSTWDEREEALVLARKVLS